MTSIRDRLPGWRAAMAVSLLLCTGLPGAAMAQADIGSSAPDFTLAARNGSVSLSALRGKLVYVDFWASWCAPCRKSFPWMNDLIERYGEQGLEIVAIDLDEDPSAADAFLAELAPRFRIAFDPQADSAKRFGLIGMPSSWLIGPDGTVLSTHVGFRDKDKSIIEAAIIQALDTLPRPAAAMPDTRSGV